MTEREPLSSPRHWPQDVQLLAGRVEPVGDIVFEGTTPPWSRARRTETTVYLEWSDVRFEISTDHITVDADEPLSMADLYWNSLVACVQELRGTPTVHGFMAADRMGSGVAVVGASGNGKTTTGLTLLDLGCTLVSDDLIVLGTDGVPCGRPFVRTIPFATPNPSLDVGGKSRIPHETTSGPVRLRRVLILDDAGGAGIKELSALAATDQLLRHPYLPFEPNRQGTRHRLEAVSRLLGAGLEVSLAPPRKLPPSKLAGHLLRT